MFTFTPLSAQARTMRRKSLWRAREKATMTRSTPSCSTIASRSARLPMTGIGGRRGPFRRGSPSSRNPTSLMRYSGCAAILAASVCPTSPAPMISTRSLNDARDHTVTLPTQRARGTRMIIRNQKAISGATGVCVPMPSTRMISSSQLAAVSAVRPVRPSPRLKPPTLRAGSRYMP